eukprot:43419-Eustigmatos_ZCMA.PRE.1
MRAFPTDRDLQREGCQAMRRIATSHSHHLVEEGGCKLVTDAICAFPNDHDIQRQGRETIVTLATDPLRSSWVCKLVSNTMRTFPTARELQVNGCGAISKLASNNDNRRLLGEAGA